ncbi:MAG: DoxX family membrane protein [Rhodospirillales bacterium]|nr:DoxX family membrane protein [Rhodospirillales bacterium]
MRPNPFDDAIAFLTRPAWTTPAFWLLLLASIAIALSAWRRAPGQRSLHDAAIWLLRVLVGIMWWQQSLWKIPPDEGGLIYWMKQEVAHAAVALQAAFVARIVLPHIAVFGPAVYAIEVGIGASLMLGLFTRGFAVLGLAMAVNLWLGLYSAPGEWPWTYMFLVVLMALFALDPPGRCLGLDAAWRRRQRSGARLRLLA